MSILWIDNASSFNKVKLALATITRALSIQFLSLIINNLPTYGAGVYSYILDLLERFTILIKTVIIITTAPIIFPLILRGRGEI
jgi:hypothetical protein